MRATLRVAVIVVVTGVLPMTGDCIRSAFSEETPRSVEAAREHFAGKAGSILSEYVRLLKLPNAASDERNIRRNAEWIREALGRRGVAAELLELDGAPPLVYGSVQTPGARRTLGLYAHYDGQPVVPEKWSQSPWEPTLYTRAIDSGGTVRALPEDGDAPDPEWRLYARSVSDDRAPIMALLAALDALRSARVPLDSNLIILFEGEEEAGSPHLHAYFDRYRARLDADVWLILDGPTHQSGRPQLVFGVRGITGLEITVFGANRPLHSGHYGNWAPNPAMALSQLLASMKDVDGRVTIEGFYDSVAPASAELRQAARTVPPIDDELRLALGLAATEAGSAPYLDRLLIPSLNVRGLVSGAVGARARNVIPTSAAVSIDVRLVKGNDPKRMLDKVEAHIRGQGYHIVREDPTPAERLAHARIAKVSRGHGYRAVRTAMDLPVVRWVRQRAGVAAGAELVLMPTMGGSLPLYLFEDKLARPLVIVPIVNHDNNQHGPDENLKLGNLEYGVVLLASLLGAE